MPPRQIVVLGGGFAGLWSAVAAARKLDELRIGSDEVAVTLVNRDAFHNIRVRNYESDLSAVRVPLDEVLEPIGVRLIEAEVTGFNLKGRSVALKSSAGAQQLGYDRLVFALGSELVRPAVPGLAAHGFDVDTYAAAIRLHEHLESLPKLPDAAGRSTVIVVGAGLTGIEVATEMPGKLHSVFEGTQPGKTPASHLRVILVDHNPLVGSDMGDSARPVIEQALSDLQIETRLGVRVVAIDAGGVMLSSGERLPAATVIWCAGLRANPVTTLLPGAHDRLGRVSVDEYLRVIGVPKMFAAGDVAAAMMDERHVSVMSCQHSRPMGRFAGHNAVCDLLGLPLLPLQIDWYVTVLDLGPCGAVYTTGWNRQVMTQGAAAKRTKQMINCQRIYPPRTRNRAEILAAAAPLVQRPPMTGQE